MPLRRRAGFVAADDEYCRPEGLTRTNVADHASDDSLVASDVYACTDYSYVINSLATDKRGQILQSIWGSSKSTIKESIPIHETFPKKKHNLISAYF